MHNSSIEEKIISAFFLCSTGPNALLGAMDKELNENADSSIDSKVIMLQRKGFVLDEVCPCHNNISSEIDRQGFLYSVFSQPLLFLRLRPGREEEVLQKLNAAGINYHKLSPSGIGLANSSKVDELIDLDKDAVVQDYNSQKVLDGFSKYNMQHPTPKLSVWDCCAASGGKSILLYDIIPHVNLTVSDIRASILKNLHNRFARAGIKNYRSFVADISAPQFVPAKKYNLVLCDAPCSGSGTWSRTPEQLLFFSEEKLEYYSNLQKWIVLNAAKAVEKNGAFLYITCSVYKQENEDVVAYLQEKTNLKLQNMQYYKGYTIRADTLFAALFTL